MARKPDKRKARRDARPAKPRGGKAGLTPFRSSTHRMSEDHAWRCREGYQIFVVNRGQVRFEFPQGWRFDPGTHDPENPGGNVCYVRDAPEPRDECRISVTVMPLPPGAGESWCRDTDLAWMVETSTDRDDDAAEGVGEDGRPIYPRRPPDPVESGTTGNYEWASRRWAWHDKSVTDRERWVVAHHVQARTPGVHVLITFEYYEDRAADFGPHYGHFRDSLRLSEPVDMDGRKLMN